MPGIGIKFSLSAAVALATLALLATLWVNSSRPSEAQQGAMRNCPLQAQWAIAVWDSDPAWSPDGAKIAFVSDRDGNLEIYVINTDGTGQTNLTNNPADDDRPAWRQ